jgi:VWFA-related protein
MEALQLNAILSGTSPDLSNVNTSNPGNVAAAQSRASMAQMRAQVDLARRGQDAIITLEDMQQVAQYFGAVPGRKSLLWISAGFPFALGSAATSNTKGVLFEDWERTVRALADANVAVYPVDVTGLLPGVNANNLAALDSTAIRAGGAEGGVAARSKQLEAVDTGAFADPNMARQETMRQLADMTGGQAFYNANNTVDLLRRAAEDSGRYYLLAYYTKDTGKAGWRKLNVKVDRDGAKIRARAGYFFHSAAGDTEANRQAEEMMAMQSDLNFSSIPIRGQWQQIETTGNDRKVRFLLSIPAGVPYIDAEHENHISYDFRVIVTNSSGVAVSRNGQRLDTNLAALDVTQIRSSGLDYANEVVLPPGQYTVHFVVRDNLRGALGSVVTPLKVD